MLRKIRIPSSTGTTHPTCLSQHPFSVLGVRWVPGSCIPPRVPHPPPSSDTSPALLPAFPLELQPFLWPCLPPLLVSAAPYWNLSFPAALGAAGPGELDVQALTFPTAPSSRLAPPYVQNRCVLPDLAGPRTWSSHQVAVCLRKETRLLCACFSSAEAGGPPPGW